MRETGGMKIFGSADELRAAAGTSLGTSEWLTIDQDRIDLFAKATDDYQWIHVDQARAADGPFGSTIAHGYLTLALLPRFAWETYRLEGAVAAVNYGSNRVRFVHPVRVGSRIRCTTHLDGVSDAGDALQVTTTQKVTVEVDARERLACIAEVISRVTFGTP
ncbi:MaoC family dehydratase [Krasilnikovia sp. MM14-A1259]|uniref:MaoC family dehydratase n=1 Tax=Krasilnikovia sp. MM14-A1259 TaxID=3373539 RepID=UPI0038004EBD